MAPGGVETSVFHNTIVPESAQVDCQLAIDENNRKMFFTILPSYRTFTVLSNFCRLIKLLSSSQLLLSTFFSLSVHHINMHPLNTTHTATTINQVLLPIQATKPGATRGLLICFPVKVSVDIIRRTRRTTFAKSHSIILHIIIKKHFGQQLVRRTPHSSFVYGLACE